MKKILIINGHPKKESFNNALFESYVRGAEERGAEIRKIYVTDLPLENYLRFDHFGKTKPGDEIKKIQDDIAWADHLVFVHPVWWSGTPAIMKCFIDMVFTAGFAFKYDGKSPLPKKLLKGRTARIILTLDTPIFVYKYFFWQPSVNQLRDRVLSFCGIGPTKVTYIGPVRTASEEKRKKFLDTVYKLGKNLA